MTNNPGLNVIRAMKEITAESVRTARTSQLFEWYQGSIDVLRTVPRWNGSMCGLTIEGVTAEAERAGLLVTAEIDRRIPVPPAPGLVRKWYTRRLDLPVKVELPRFRRLFALGIDYEGLSAEDVQRVSVHLSWSDTGAPVLQAGLCLWPIHGQGIRLAGAPIDGGDAPLVLRISDVVFDKPLCGEVRVSWLVEE